MTIRLGLRPFAVASLVAVAARAVSFEPDAPATPPVEADGWTAPEVSFGLTARLSVDTAFDAAGENVASLLRRAQLTVRTSRGPLRLLLGARLRWVTSEERPDAGPFRLVNGARRRSALEVLPAETSVAVTRFGIDWSAGLLDVAWGQNPLLAAADVLGPVDLRDGPFAGPNARLPMPALRARGRLGPVTWDALYLPVFVPSRLPLFGNDWGPFVPGRPAVVPDLSRALDPTALAGLETGGVATRSPQGDLTAPQGGLRLSARPGGVDVALTWAEFFDRQPRYTFTPAFERLSDALQQNDRGGALTALVDVQRDLDLGRAPLTAEYVRTRVVAFDAAVLAGPLRLTLDAGYSPERVLPTSDLHTQLHPSANGALGVEYEGPPVIAAGLGAWAAFGVRAEERLLSLETDAAPARDRDALLAFGYLFASHRLLDDRLRLQLSALASQHGDLLAMPRAGFAFSEGHSLAVGAMLVGGPRGGAGWMFHRNAEAFVEYGLQL